MALAIGVDLGGTKIEVVALDEQGHELLRRRRPTPRGSYEGTLDTIRDLVLELEHELGARGTVGVGHPGAISPATGLIKNANSTWLNGRTLDKDLVAKLGRPVALANDANCLALSEATDGAGAGAPVVFAVILGTGVGGGVVVGGRLVSGANAIGGEWGHNPLPTPRERRAAGRRLLLRPRTAASRHGSRGPALAADHRRRYGEVLKLGRHRRPRRWRRPGRRTGR